MKTIKKNSHVFLPIWKKKQTFCLPSYCMGPPPFVNAPSYVSYHLCHTHIYKLKLWSCCAERGAESMSSSQRAVWMLEHPPHASEVARPRHVFFGPKVSHFFGGGSRFLLVQWLLFSRSDLPCCSQRWQQSGAEGAVNCFYVFVQANTYIFLDWTWLSWVELNFFRLNWTFLDWIERLSTLPISVLQVKLGSVWALHVKFWGLSPTRQFGLCVSPTGEFGVWLSSVGQFFGYV